MTWAARGVLDKCDWYDFKMPSGTLGVLWQDVDVTKARNMSMKSENL